MERVYAAPRAARQSQWLLSALAQFHGPDPAVQNEIVVLATGIDQYLQEVFHHLSSAQEDTVSAEDFTGLCAVLGLSQGPQTEQSEGPRAELSEGPRTEQSEGPEQEDEDVCAQLPPQLSFKDFHARLCGFFRVRSARTRDECSWRLPVSEETELVQRKIRLRWPRSRRKKCVSFDLMGDQCGRARGAPRGTCAEEAVEEAAALRELVEDLRSALQSSDARCLALEVALRKERSRRLTSPSTISTITTRTSSPSSISFREGKLVPTHRIRGGSAVSSTRRRDARDTLLRELKLIRSARDGQLREAMKFTERLEEELRWAFEEVRKLRPLESALRKENAHIRRRAEEAREALSAGLDRVRLLQEQAHSVPKLQLRIRHLETELQQHSLSRLIQNQSTVTFPSELRSRCSCVTSSSARDWTEGLDPDSTKATECLQRAVEGKAASDEEEDHRDTAEEKGRHLLDTKRHCTRTHSCGKGCPDRGRHRGTSLNQDNKESKAPDKTPQAADQFQRMSLLEEKLTDALSLLLQLRNKNVSSRALGRIVMDTLDLCCRNGDGPPQVLHVAEELCVRLSSSELFTDREGDSETDKLLPLVARQSNSTSSLLISC